jgi:hypothetical protein
MLLADSESVARLAELFEDAHSDGITVEVPVSEILTECPRPGGEGLIN